QQQPQKSATATLNSVAPTPAMMSQEGRRPSRPRTCFVLAVGLVALTLGLPSAQGSAFANGVVSSRMTGRRSCRSVAGGEEESPKTLRRCAASGEDEGQEEPSEEDDEEMANDPGWVRVKQDMLRIWGFRNEGEWAVADDVK
ncbi:unnamed protein product, partial [Polarella glacialis]